MVYLKHGALSIGVYGCHCTSPTVTTDEDGLRKSLPDRLLLARCYCVFVILNIRELLKLINLQMP